MTGVTNYDSSARSERAPVTVPSQRESPRQQIAPSPIKPVSLVNDSAIPSPSVFQDTSLSNDLTASAELRPSQKIRGANEELRNIIKATEISEIKDELTDHIVNKLYKISINNFGGIRSMLSAFRKREGETLSFYEFSENMKKYGLDDEFTSTDMGILFDRIGTRSKVASESEIDVNRCIMKVQQQENKDTAIYRENTEMSKFLVDEVHRRRQNTSTLSASLSSASLSALQIGQGLTMKEVDETLDHILNSTSSKAVDLEEKEKNTFARYIRATSTRLDMIPFYPMRATELEAMEKNATQLAALANDPVLVNRQKELTLKRIERLEGTIPKIQSRENKTQDSTSSIVLRSSDPAFRQKSTRDLSGKRDEVSMSDFSSSREDFSPLPKRFSSPYKSRIEIGSGIFESTFKDSIYDLDSIARDSIPNGTKRMDKQYPADWERAGMTMGYVDDKVENVHRHQGATADYFPPLIYEPSKPVARQLESDSTREFKEREAKRNFRYRRTMENVKRSDERIELDRLNGQLVEIKKAEFRNANLMRYKNAILINDMKTFKKLPMSTISLKPHFSQADKLIWSSQFLPSSREDRDFNTTYQLSFDSSILTSTDKDRSNK